MDKLTAVDVVDLLEDYVERFGADYQGQMCYYNTDGQPECGNGHIFNDLGFSRERVFGFGGKAPVTLYWRGELPEVTENAAELMSVIMVAHDRANLGAARDAAKALYERMVDDYDFEPETESQPEPVTV